ncbi:uncharacterized protein LOC123566603 isoform X2 [Mercenaria mercenaria]|uniref:uncharacterized protein LOC123566603 isoform X2 n=1 Tax=Mercenaria mercenaria TaxID=6596 RepID=UPI00234FAAC7|nr:uncharacterized protein LOC123566603 isoform X2 [Mercenaria mercenaria]
MVFSFQVKNNDRQKPKGKKWRKERMSGKILGNYVINGRIGHGGTACVYQAECHGKINACKVTDGKYSDGLLKEYEILRSLEHQNILKVFDCIACNRVVVMAIERLPASDLHDFIIRKWPVPSEVRRKYTKQIVSAVEHMHYKDIAHCDLKLENMLIDTTGDIKIIDFGSALRVSEATYDDFAYIATTPEYLPPEIFCASADDTYDIRAIDEWSVGIVLFIMLTGRFPFGEVDQTKIAKYIKKMRSVRSFELRKSEERFLYFEHDYLEIVRGLLAFKPENRLPVSKALSMAYFTKGMDIEDIEKEIDDDFSAIFDDI